MTRDGAVLNGLDINGYVLIKANNVTIKNSRILCVTKCTAPFTIQVRPEVTGTVITDVEAGASSSVGAVIGGGGPFTLIRSNIHGGLDGIHVITGTVVTQSYIHDLTPSDISHSDTIQQVGAVADSITIRDNTLLPFNATTNVYNNAGYICGSQCVSTSNLVFQNNLLNGGSHTLHCSDANNTNNVYSGNRFGSNYLYAPIDVTCLTAPGNFFDATNIMDGTNGPVLPGSVGTP